jgi:threonine dehydrogenase-like Zn-dependent dehydrogenase
VVEEGVQMLRMRGTYLEVGHISPNSIAKLDVQKMVQNQIRFYGVQHYDPWIIPNAIDLLVRTANRYPLTNVISHEFPIEKIGDAFETAEWVGKNSGSVVTRAVVTP